MLGSRELRLLTESQSRYKKKEAKAVKPYLVGAGKNFLKMVPSSRDFLEPVKEIYKKGSKDPGARPFLEGAGAGEKR